MVCRLACRDRPAYYSLLRLFLVVWEVFLVLAELGQSFWANTIRHLYLAPWLFSLCEELGEEEIPAIPYKGTALAATVYEDLSPSQPVISTCWFIVKILGELAIFLSLKLTAPKR